MVDEIKRKRGRPKKNNIVENHNVEDLKKHMINLEEKLVLAQEQIMDTKIRKHKDGYIHIPFSWGGFGRGCASLGSIGLVVLNFFSLMYFWNYFNIGYLFQLNYKIVASNISLSQLFFLYPLFFWWFSVWLCAFCVKAWHDGNWDNLNELVFGLVVGLVFGLVVGLVIGLVIAIFES